jgi:hypothetical protein
MAATVRASYESGAGPTLVSAETGAKFNREETLAGTTPVPKPNATGTNFSYPKSYRLEVTATDTTSISNFRHNMSSSPATGLKLWFRDDGATYQRPNAVAAADNGTTDDATPSGYTVESTSAAVYDAASYATSSTGGKGDHLSVALGISNLYVGGAGGAIALPNEVLTYDEA